jgi:hypothetical protein
MKEGRSHRREVIMPDHRDDDQSEKYHPADPDDRCEDVKPDGEEVGQLVSAEY